MPNLEPPTANAPASGAQAYSYGASLRPPRGNYAAARPDYTCEQQWQSYSSDEHDRYRRLYEDRIAKLPGLACEAFISSLTALDAAKAIPHLANASIALRKTTGWELVGVPGLIPENAFFKLLSERRFPITTWLREESEFNYIVEPDIFHDFFGHVPLLFNPMFADYMQAYGRGGLKADRLNALEYLARLYWYTVEFGLINTKEGLRIYGAGILSSGNEPHYSLFSPKPKRIGFDLRRVMATTYRIDDFQDTYFVIDSFEQLFEATAPDFTHLYTQVAQGLTFSPGQVTSTDRVFRTTAER